MDQLIRDGKATAIEVGNAVFVKIRRLEWSENTNVNRNVGLGGVSQGAQALGDNVDLDSIATMFDEMISNTPVNVLDMGDARLMRIQMATRNFAGMAQTHSGQVHGIPMHPLQITDGTKIVTVNEKQNSLK